MAELTDKNLLILRGTVDENYCMNKPHYAVQLLRQSNVTNARRLSYNNEEQTKYLYSFWCANPCGNKP